MEAGQLDGGFDGFRAGVGQEGASGTGHRSDAVQLGGQFGVDGQVEVGRREVQQLAGLVLDRCCDARVVVAGRADGDAGREVEEEVVVDVLDGRALTAHGHQRVGARQAGRRVPVIEGDVLAGLGARQRGADIGNRPAGRGLLRRGLDARVGRWAFGN